MPTLRAVLNSGSRDPTSPTSPMVMTERTRSDWLKWVLWAGFAGASLRDMVKSSVIWERLGVEPLLLSIERSQLRWFKHLGRMPPGHLPRLVFLAHPTGKRPREVPWDQVERWYFQSVLGHPGYPPVRVSPSLRRSKGKSGTLCLWWPVMVLTGETETVSSLSLCEAVCCCCWTCYAMLPYSAPSPL